jgi:hypothetical protein
MASQEIKKAGIDRTAETRHYQSAPFRQRWSYPTDCLTDESLRALHEIAATTAGQRLPPPALLRHPIKFLSYLFLSSELKQTGLEEISLETLLQLKRDRGAFVEAQTKEALLKGSWAQLMSPDLLIEGGRLSPTAKYYRHHLRDIPLIELGPGEMASAHQKIVREIFGCSSYSAVDQNADIKNKWVKNEDLLSFLSRQPTASANVMAFGVLNEPLSLTLDMRSGFMLPAKDAETAARKHVEFEYIRRLAKELARVIPPGGLLMGAGLHSRSCEPEMRNALLSAGFTIDLLGHGLIEAELSTKDRGVRDPFFLINRRGIA